MRNLKRSTKVFAGVEEVSVLHWLETESVSVVSHWPSLEK